MFCIRCGIDLPDDSEFCRRCGHAQASPPGVTLQIQNVASSSSEQLASTTSGPGVAAAPLQSGTQTTTKPGRLSALKKLKRIAWRVTAGYLWLRFVVDSVASDSPLHSVETFTVHRWTAYLSSVGFAPGNPDYMLPILKMGWMLTITVLDPWQFVGFWVYVFFFPLWMLFRVCFGEHLNQSQSTPQALGKSQQRKALLPVSVGLLIAWFLLYGNSTAPKQILVGVVCSGVFFVSLAFRAFHRARPLAEKDIVLAPGLEKLAASAVADTTRLKPANKSAAGVNIKFEKFHKCLLVWFVYFFRGRRGRDRVAMYILVEYVAFLLLLAFSAVLFWGLTIRFSAPSLLSVKQSCLLSASHFLPGMVVPGVPSTLPLWTQFGPSLTAWILFVLFVGPAASLLPARQGVYAGQLDAKCRLFRKHVVKLKERIRHICETRDRLPS